MNGAPLRASSFSFLPIFIMFEKKSFIFGSFSMHVFGISVGGDDGEREGETMWLEKLSCDI